MRIIRLTLFFTSWLLATQELNLDYAISSKPLNSIDSQVIKSKDNLRFFSYTNQLHPNHFAPSLSLESSKSMIMQAYHLPTQKSQFHTLNYFENTHDLKALALKGERSLVAALSSKDKLKVAIVDQNGIERSTYSNTKERFNTINSIFSQKDGTFFILLSVSNAHKRLDYFNRGVSADDMMLIHLNPNLRPIEHQLFGSMTDERLVSAAINEKEIFTILTQKDPTNFILYTFSFLTHKIKKRSWVLPKADRLLSIFITFDEKVMLGGSHSTLYELTDTLRMIPLSEISNGAIHTISQDQRNQWILSGTCTSGHGDQDGFLTLLHPDFKPLWLRKAQTPFNEHALYHVLDGSKIDFFAKRFTQEGQEHLFYISISQGGFTYKPMINQSVSQNFIKTLQKKVAGKYQRLLDILPSSEIVLTNYYNPQSSEISESVLNDLRLFFHDFIEVVSQKSFSKQIDKIYFNGFTSSEWHNANDSDRYLNNAKLSQDRAFTLLKALITNTVSSQQRLWLQDHIVLSGFGPSQTVKNSKSLENFEKSRRATLTIIWK